MELSIAGGVNKDEPSTALLDARKGFERMVPNDNEPKPAVPVVGVVTTFIYEGPFAWPRKRRSAETPPDGEDRSNRRLELIDGVTRPVTYVYENWPYGLKKKE